MGDAGIKSAIQGSNVFFFFNDTATTEIYTTHNTLSLHDALPIYILRTGSLGDVMKESVEAARSVVRARASRLEIGRAHV